MRSRKSHHLQESEDSDDSDKSAENSTASEETEVSSDDEVDKKSKKRKKQSSSSDSDSENAGRRRNKKKKHRKKKRKHSKKKRQQSSDDEDSDTNEEVSSEEGDVSPPKKKRKRKHKQKHSKKKRSKPDGAKTFPDKYESQEDYSKRAVTLSDEEISLSSEGDRRETVSHRTEEHLSYKYQYHSERSKHNVDTNEVNRFYRGSSKDRQRRSVELPNRRYVKEVPADRSLPRDRYNAREGHHERAEVPAPARFEQYNTQVQRFDNQAGGFRYKERKEGGYAAENYHVKYDRRNQNYDNRFNNNNRQRFENTKFNRFPESNQNNRFEDNRYQKEKEDNLYRNNPLNVRKDINVRADYNRPDFRDNRYGDTRRDNNYQQKSVNDCSGYLTTILKIALHHFPVHSFCCLRCYMLI